LESNASIRLFNALSKWMLDAVPGDPKRVIRFFGVKIAV